jgi:hypothetical protein
MSEESWVCANPTAFLIYTITTIMADEALPSISTGAVGSRFVSQSDIEAARARRDEQWKAAYARFLRLSLSQLFSSSITFFHV